MKTLKTIERNLYRIIGNDCSINCIEELTENVIVLSSPGNNFPLGEVNAYLCGKCGYYNVGFGMIHHIYTYAKGI